ncbi:hypothetical protein B7P43_G12434 [Cryptotermes secundus]|uniref:SCP domain-containing protein n=1 Tax=Cryptotermes secundus TaxID=105785 RepID=A0A2J7PBS5_9NEOP|nr:hypothetical protein B7P43_G12434 [Cryptotermes secundus]
MEDLGRDLTADGEQMDAKKIPGKRAHEISSVGIETGYEMDGRGVGVRVPLESRIFSSTQPPVRLWDPPSLLSNGALWRPLGRPRRRWVDNIKMDLREIGWDGMDWIDLSQDRDQWRAFVNTKEEDTRDTKKMKVFLLLASLVVGLRAQSCSYSSVCSDHTMCKYQGYGSKCGQPIHSGVTSNSDKQKIVDAHNNLRRKVAKGQETQGKPGPQPSAANMKKISWDNELATVAQRWADQCSFGHDACRNVGRFYVGQNVYQSSTKGSSPNGQQDWQSAVQAWYNEVKDFSKNSVSPFKYSSGAGHYSQVVWATSDKIGCGFTAYAGSDGWYNKMYVCNYGPGGNVIGGSSSMYTIGGACSKCSGNCDNGLCV